MYGPRHESRTLPWVKFKFFLEKLFICNIIDKNLNKNFDSYLSYYSFKLLFLFFQVCAINSSKKFEKKNGSRQGTFPYFLCGLPRITR